MSLFEEMQKKEAMKAQGLNPVMKVIDGDVRAIDKYVADTLVSLDRADELATREVNQINFDEAKIHLMNICDALQLDGFPVRYQQSTSFIFGNYTDKGITIPFSFSDTSDITTAKMKQLSRSFESFLGGNAA